MLFDTVSISNHQPLMISERWADCKNLPGNFSLPVSPCGQDREPF